MEAGRLDRRIRLQKKNTVALDPYGHPTPNRSSWTDVATPWAEVKESSARERLGSAQTLAARAATVRIRYPLGYTVTPEMRVVYKGLFWNIKSVTELGRREALEMMIEVVEVKT